MDLTVKTSLTWGDHDTLSPPPQSRDIKSLIGGASLLAMRDLGHILQIENAAAFTPLLVECLRART